jgi:diguanylate cyclase (GGDEF)-like protein
MKPAAASALVVALVVVVSLWLFGLLFRRLRPRFGSGHHPVTGLPGTDALCDRLVGDIPHVWLDRAKVALLVIDLDRLHRINKELGRGYGDRALRELVADLQSVCGRSAQVFHLDGGPQLAVLVRGRDTAEALELAERIGRAVKGAERAWRGKALRLSVSIGVTDVQRAGADRPAEVVSSARRALALAKIRGRDRAVVASLRPRAPQGSAMASPPGSPNAQPGSSTPGSSTIRGVSESGSRQAPAVG